LQTRLWSSEESADSILDELRKVVWNEAIESAIGLFRKRHRELPSVIDCLDMTDGASEPGQVRRRPRLFRVEIKADENGSPTWNEKAYPESFDGGIVQFLASKGEDHCEGLDINLTFPGSAAAGENKAEAV
jgi:hypothetical protein